VTSLAGPAGGVTQPASGGKVDLPPDRSLPPGQRLVATLPVMHYGPVPRPRPERWRFTIGGATEDGIEREFSLGDLLALPHTEVVADLHCATHWSVLDQRWSGVRARDAIDLAPPADGVDQVLVFAEFGYAATVRLEDLASARTLLATGLDGRPLTPDHGAPMRLVIPHLYSWKGPKWVRGWNYLTEPQRGFWEERGYHMRGDAWLEERYAYQE
jgi:DMSO/TMAO reductase YedYZ molybdopterin-dependent catalytic subunit